MATQASIDAAGLVGSNLPEFTVGELSRALKRTVEDAYGRVRVRGEISGLKRAASGHIYLCLKDAEANMDAVCWRGTVGRLALKPEDGMEVICVGRLTTYMERSRYQLVIESIELSGEGALLKLLEDRRKKLAAEGLFDPDRKKKLPYLPDVIGVVTSPTGAVIRDILHRLAERFPRHVLIWPVLVQGEGAAAQVAAAIEGFNRLEVGGKVARPDLLIVARGGGSLEDLWAFNEEIVVRAAAASAIPLISAVGHETDTTLIDFAADRRAPTPTAAAEMAVPVRAELLTELLKQERRLVACAGRVIADRRVRVDDLARALPRPQQAIEERAQRLDGWSERMGNALRVLVDDRARRVAHGWASLPRPEATLAAARRVADATMVRLRPGLLARRFDDGERRATELAQRMAAAGGRALVHARQRFDALSGLLDSYSYERVLERGFVLVRDAHGKPVTEANQTKPGQHLGLRFHDGEVGTTVSGPSVAPARPTRKPPTDGSQGSLL
ncbi:MAG: exodeoxyribonuclease VII large subunit [Alphaproteobacteria bacterium]|nr:exodeoxyribonuclease VII large subunit [Alphaproteobacteria bacterium]